MSGQVCEGFDGSSTRDGNVGGRFLGYARGKWARQLELEPAGGLEGLEVVFLSESATCPLVVLRMSSIASSSSRKRVS